MGMERLGDTSISEFQSLMIYKSLMLKKGNGLSVNENAELRIMQKAGGQY